MSQTDSGNRAERAELYKSAIAFLSDPSVSDAPLAKKVEFLESKGLSQSEIDSALKEAKENPQELQVSNFNTYQSKNSEYEPQYEAVPPPLPQRDWKDYFFMATSTAGLCYGLYQLTKRYVLPNLLPESHSKLEQDKLEIAQQFDRMEQLLETIDSEHSAYVKKENEKFEELDQVVNELSSALKTTTRTREKLEDDVRIMRLEIEGLQKNLETFISENTDSPAVRRLSDEILSLKNLIKNSDFLRDAPTPSDHNKSPIPGVEVIPSASEILAKMNLPKKNDHDVPAWKKSRENTVTEKSIPEWQVTAAEKPPTPIPDWQKAMFNAESPSPDPA
ncbi:LADA_0E11936g1_1 [Lachancea dasiensis]|uniref:Peroxisomal membrane protein PEX14 n=1 Tax=Lachancea dasiensis TaxID=1072105 RepID=A0A1G4JF58_9SACH|nr:LADA_0E11936g1_1 [Lachancea dasiensis]